MQEKTLPLVLAKKTYLFSLTLVSLSSFLIPFLLGHPQLLVGTLVNAALLFSALYFEKKFIYPIIFFPSLAVLSRGLIFGPLTPFLFLMLPFIWLGNFILVFIFQRLYLFNFNFWFCLLLSSLTKAVFLYSITLLLFNFQLLPKLFLTTMGVIQFITAISGGVLVFFCHKLIKKI